LIEKGYSQEQLWKNNLGNRMFKDIKANKDILELQNENLSVMKIYLLKLQLEKQLMLSL
jgi:hypothetical protein